MKPTTLVCHPSTRTGAIDGINAHMVRQPSILAVTFTLTGDPSGVLIPRASAPRIAYRLWEHTCFEVFVAAEGADAYHEFNLSPSGEWMAHAFRGYRDGGPLAADTLNPEIATRQRDRSFELSATLGLDRLSVDYARSSLRVGLSAVIEDARGSLSCWALRHPPGKPDFHHRDVFALRLEAPDMDAKSNPR